MKVSEIMTGKNLVILPSNATVSEAFAKMRGTGVHQVPVLNGSTYSGMLLFRELLKKRSVQSTEKIGSIIIKTPKLRESDNITVAADLIKKAGIPALPVVSRGKLLGIVSRTDLLRNLNEFGPVNEVRVRDAMTSNPEYVYDNDGLRIALEKMRSLDESEFPVLSKDGKLAGIIRIKDLSSSALLRGENAERDGNLSGETRKVDPVCSSIMGNPISIKPDITLGEAAREILKHGLHTIPVTNNDNILSGVLGVMDILHMIRSTGRQKGILIQVSGLNEYDDDLYDIIFFEGEKFISRISRMSGINSGSFNVHVAKYHSTGRIKYSVRTRLYGGHTNMAVDDFDWNFGKCMSKIFETYENRLKKSR
ncbi:MAG: CBS domain-containing protein [Candidatus Thermoplasmatota archaeon]|nr:CBS domain-containing protein [Candidatus Thermoplasmatota archaeon]